MGQGGALVRALRQERLQNQGQRSSLAFGLVGARAFPPVRLPLLVKPTNADPLAAPHRNVLFH